MTARCCGSSAAQSKMQQQRAPRAGISATYQRLPARKHHGAGAVAALGVSNSGLSNGGGVARVAQKRLAARVSRAGKWRHRKQAYHPAASKWRWRHGEESNNEIMAAAK